MSVVRVSLLLLAAAPELEWALGQRAPCYQCEVYKDSHPQARPYQEIRSQCSYPCECGAAPRCAPGVAVVRDGCGCCPLCARQLGDACHAAAPCDPRLVCEFPHRDASRGVCRAIKGLPCTVYNRTYDNGETFLLDCRTQCACQNGTYACASLCPQESISPQGACKRPRLVEVPGQCCREWLCDSDQVEEPPRCQSQASSWSECSAACGVGTSRRVANDNPQCRPRNQTRLCHLRPCGGSLLLLSRPLHWHHVRKGHECKATQRARVPVRLQAGGCVSVKQMRPKACGACGQCVPQLSTTLAIPFRCPRGARPFDATPGAVFWTDAALPEDGLPATLPVQWVLKCVCQKPEALLHRVHRASPP